MSFVLKNGNGALAGYLLQQQGKICLRAQGLPRSGGTLVLIGRDGRERERKIEQTEQEQCWPDEGMTIASAYIMEGTALSLLTGEEARTAYLRRKNATEKQKPRAAQSARERKAETKTPKAAEPEEEKPPAAKDDVQRTIPERRWPPPPCCPRARYEQGKWVCE